MKFEKAACHSHSLLSSHSISLSGWMNEKREGEIWGTIKRTWTEIVFLCPPGLKANAEGFQVQNAPFARRS